jgi:hypothetical protein
LLAGGDIIARNEGQLNSCDPTALADSVNSPARKSIEKAHARTSSLSARRRETASVCRSYPSSDSAKVRLVAEFKRFRDSLILSRSTSASPADSAIRTYQLADVNDPGGGSEGPNRVRRGGGFWFGAASKRARPGWRMERTFASVTRASASSAAFRPRVSRRFRSGQRFAKPFVLASGGVGVW